MLRKLYLQTQPVLFMKWRQRCLFRGSMWFYLTLPFCCYLVSFWLEYAELELCDGAVRQLSKSLKRRHEVQSKFGNSIVQYTISHTISHFFFFFCFFFVCVKGLHQKLCYFKIKKESKDLWANVCFIKKRYIYMFKPLNNIWARHSPYDNLKSQRALLQICLIKSMCAWRSHSDAPDF